MRREPTAGEQRDEALKVEIRRVHARQLRRLRRPEGVAGAEPGGHRGGPLHGGAADAGELGLAGAVRGKVKSTTIADPAGHRAADLVGRRFSPTAPDRLWVADFTYVSTWSGWVYVAFVIDAYSRRILGWRCGTTMTTQLVLDALEQAIWTRHRTGPDLRSVVAQATAASQYTSLRTPSGSPRPASRPRSGPSARRYDNALAETINGLYKTELIKPRGPWTGIDDVEIATAEWVDWFNHRRLYEYCGDIPPAEARSRLLRSHHQPQAAG